MKLSLRLKNISVPIQLFIYVVIMPSLLAGIYYGWVASDIYVSEARYAIRSNADSPATNIVDTVISSAMSGGSPTSEDAKIVMDYSLSLSMLELLDEHLQVHEHYSSKDIDALARLDQDALMEEFLEYYKDMVSITIDSNTNVTTLRVRAFSPEKAQDIAKTIIDISEDLVNSMSDRMVNDFLKFARNEVENAEIRVKNTSRALTNFRSKNSSIDPGQETSAVLGIVTELETRLASARAELLEAKSFMGSNSTQVKILESKVRALEKQSIRERTRLANEEASTVDYTQLIDLYEPLLLDQELAKEFYTSALSSLELARAEAQRKQRYLITFVEPKKPEEAVEPERIYVITTILLLLIVTFAIGGLIWAAIKDHLRI